MLRRYKANYHTIPLAVILLEVPESRRGYTVVRDRRNQSLDVYITKTCFLFQTFNETQISFSDWPSRLTNPSRTSTISSDLPGTSYQISIMS